MKKRSIVWLTTNIRLLDNAPLARAVEESFEVVPVFCIDKAWFNPTRFGYTKMGFYRTRFLFEGLQDLHARLQGKGSGLVVVYGDPLSEITRLVKELDADAIYALEEFAPEEKQLQREVKEALRELEVPLYCSAAGNLFNDQDLPFNISQTPDVFTNYRKLVETKAVIPGYVNEPLHINSPALLPFTLPTYDRLGLNENEPDVRQAIRHKGGETEGLQRIHDYFFTSQQVLAYKQTRNGMIGADYSTKFSAWLATGCISPRTIYHQLKEFEKEFEANESTYWVIFELLWRDYFRLVIKKFGRRLFLPDGLKATGHFKGIHNSELFAKWVNGQTGNDFVDANMLELKLSGFMSNRGRQNVASYFVHNLGLDWRYGAAYFEHQLIDYDVNSNYGNWAYIAGVGNDPRPNRMFNVDKQANDYDYDKRYRKLWLKNN